MCLKVVVKVNTPTKVTIKIVDEEKNDVFAIGIIILQILGFS